MGIAYFLNRTTALALAVPLLLSLSLGGCVTASGGSSLMDAHAEAPMPAPSKPLGYLPVGDLPPARDQAIMTRDEQVKLKKELLAARDRQAIAAKSQGGPIPPMQSQ